VLNMINRGYRKIWRSLLQRGLLGTVLYIPLKLLAQIKQLRPSIRRARTAERAADTAFDKTYGVDTGGWIEPAALLDVESESWVWGYRYRPTRADVFEEIIDAAAIEPHCYSFIDYGSGKGRVLLLASLLPFRRVVGVEYSPTLNRIAEQNLHCVRPVDRQSGPVESVCIDAVSFPIPEEPVVLYFYAPFGRQIMEIVRDNVVRSYEGNPRSMVVIYNDPNFSDLWDEVGFLRRHACSNVKGREYIIYRTSPL
jgi:SAM-dependent methyltransferase